MIGRTTHVPDCHVVIRAVGERTAFACQRIVETQLLRCGNVSIVNLVPFEDALRQTFIDGMSAGAKWTITVDADTLLLPGAIKQMLRLGEAARRDTFMIQGCVFDYIMGVWRPAGHRLYRSSLLKHALPLIPIAGESIRPETATVAAMKLIGWRSKSVNHRWGAHDFGQFYGDLYRKAFVHGRKHSNLLGPMLHRCSAKQAESDEFRVVARGLWDGTMLKDVVSIDKSLFGERSVAALVDLGLTERPPLTPAEVNGFTGPDFAARFVEPSTKTPLAVTSLTQRMLGIWSSAR
jgi:hypothetical protein